MSDTTSWREGLNERQRTAVRFAESYATDFNHGASGHNDLLLIARLAGLLEYATTHGGELPPGIAREDVPIGFGQYATQTLRELAAGTEAQQGYADWLAREARDPEVQLAARRAITAEAARRRDVTREHFDNEPTAALPVRSITDATTEELPF